MIVDLYCIKVPEYVPVYVTYFSLGDKVRSIGLCVGQKQRNLR